MKPVVTRKVGIATCILFAPLAACTDEVRVTDLYGRYSYSQGDVEQVIVLQEFGVYSNTLFISGKQKWQYDATWKFDSDGSRQIEFDQFKFGIMWYGSKEYGGGQRGFWGVEPERSVFSGGILLCLDPDDAYRCFHKAG